MSMLLFNVVFSPILHDAHFNYLLARCRLIAAVIVIDVFVKSFIIFSTHHRRHVASEMGFKQDSPNLDSDSLTECSFFTECRFGFTMYPSPDFLIEYPLIVFVIVTAPWFSSVFGAYKLITYLLSKLLLTY